MPTRDFLSASQPLSLSAYQPQLFSVQPLNAAAAPARTSTFRPEWPDFRERLHRLYGGKIAPDSQHIIDDGRDDR